MDGLNEARKFITICVMKQNVDNKLDSFGETFSSALGFKISIAV